MKRVAVVIGVAVVSCVSVLAQVHPQPYQLSLTPECAMQRSGTQIDGLSLGIWSRNPQRAFALGFVNGSVGRSKGLSIGLLGNYAESYTGGTVGLLNLAKGDLSGMQLGLLNCVQNQMTGFAMGLVNHVKGEGAGWQLGVMNLDEGGFSGLQTGAINYAVEMSGVQVGAVNVTSVLSGVQVGVINCTETVGGSALQIGLANIIPQTERWFLDLPEELAPAFVVLNWRF